MNMITMFWFWIGIIGFYSIVIVGMLVIEHRYEKKQKREEELEILREVVNRNKLRDDTQVSIDDMVKYLKENNISLHKSEI